MVTQIWVALIHYLLVACINDVTGTAFTIDGDHQQNPQDPDDGYSLLEVLNPEQKTIKKPPDWNQQQQLELFGEFFA